MFKYIEGTKSITEVFIRMVKDREDTRIDFFDGSFISIHNKGLTIKR